MTQYHRPRGGNNLWTVAQYHERKAREYGLTDVSLIKQASTPAPGTRPSPTSGSTGPSRSGSRARFSRRPTWPTTAAPADAG